MSSKPFNFCTMIHVLSSNVLISWFWNEILISTFANTFSWLFYTFLKSKSNWTWKSFNYFHSSSQHFSFKVFYYSLNIFFFAFFNVFFALWWLNSIWAKLAFAPQHCYSNFWMICLIFSYFCSYVIIYKLFFANFPFGASFWFTHWTYFSCYWYSHLRLLLMVALNYFIMSFKPLKLHSPPSPQ
jgi:hypothetical protein